MCTSPFNVEYLHVFTTTLPEFVLWYVQLATFCNIYCFSHFFFQLYNSLWVLACSIISFHFFLSCVLCFQLVTPIFLKSFLTSSSHLILGLPFSLVAYGFHLYMVLATLSLVILSTYPNQLSRLYFIYLTIFSLLIIFSNSSFILSLRSPLAFCVGPNILLNIFLRALV